MEEKYIYTVSMGLSYNPTDVLTAYTTKANAEKAVEILKEKYSSMMYAIRMVKYYE